MWQNNTIRWLVVGLVIGLIGLGVMIYADWFGFEEPEASAAIAPTIEGQASQQRIYRIDSARSVVRYTVEEIFVGRGGNTATGTTNSVAGDILVDMADYANSQVGTIVINIEQFTSDSNLRDRRIRREYLESSTYPEAVFVPDVGIDFPTLIAQNQETAFAMSGDLTIKEITAPVTWGVTARLDGDVLTGSATTTILMSDYEVGPINIAGLVETADEVVLEFEFIAVYVTDEPIADMEAQATRAP